MKKGNEIFYQTMLLTGRIGAEGIGLLQLVLSVSALSFTVGSAGIRTCATYLSAGELGRGKAGDLSGVLAGCCQYSLLFGGGAAVAPSPFSCSPGGRAQIPGRPLLPWRRAAAPPTRWAFWRCWPCSG